jgi:hypothetical protein
VLMNLSEAAGQELRLSDLAESTGLSVNRISRLVDDFHLRRYVTKRRSAVDGSGAISALSSEETAHAGDGIPRPSEKPPRWVVDYPGAASTQGHSLLDLADSRSVGFRCPPDSAHAGHQESCSAMRSARSGADPAHQTSHVAKELSDQ